MVALNDIDDALWLLSRWRRNHLDTVLIIDQFEGLFTLNDREAQTRFAQLLGQAALVANVRVVLGVHDDFLIFCKVLLQMENRRPGIEFNSIPSPVGIRN